MRVEVLTGLLIKSEKERAPVEPYHNSCAKSATRAHLARTHGRDKGTSYKARHVDLIERGKNPQRWKNSAKSQWLRRRAAERKDAVTFHKASPNRDPLPPSCSGSVGNKRPENVYAFGLIKSRRQNLNRLPHADRLSAAIQKLHPSRQAYTVARAAKSASDAVKRMRSVLSRTPHLSQKC